MNGLVAVSLARSVTVASFRFSSGGGMLLIVCSQGMGVDFRVSVTIFIHSFKQTFIFLVWVPLPYRSTILC